MSRPNTSRIALPLLHPIASNTTETATIHNTSPRQASLPSTKLTPKHVLSTSQRWHHLTTRTPCATPFIYAVVTTKIYCLPTCPSRLARRANIIFFSTPKEAAREGFRACKRCKPDLSPSFLSTKSKSPALPAHTTESGDLPSSNIEQNSTAPAALQTNTTTSNTAITNTTNSLPNHLSSANVPFDPTDPSLKLHLAVRLVQRSSFLGQKISLAQLSHEVGLSKWHLQRAFKKRVGRSPREMGEELLAEHKAQADGGYDSGGSRGLDAATFPQGDGGLSEPPAIMPLDPVLVSACDTNSNFNFNTDMNMNMNLWDLDTDLEMAWKLDPTISTGSSFPGFSTGEHLTESTTSASTNAPTPTPGPMNDTMDFDPAWYTDAFSPEMDGILRDLFPEIYDEDMLFEDGEMVMSK
jgi:methylphosphotriester-DNA--protein-cysteine methyltransferase